MLLLSSRLEKGLPLVANSSRQKKPKQNTGFCPTIKFVFKGFFICRSNVNQSRLKKKQLLNSNFRSRSRSCFSVALITGAPKIFSLILTQWRAGFSLRATS